MSKKYEDKNVWPRGSVINGKTYFKIIGDSRIFEMIYHGRDNSTFEPFVVLFHLETLKNKKAYQDAFDQLYPATQYVVNSFMMPIEGDAVYQITDMQVTGDRIELYSTISEEYFKVVTHHFTEDEVRPINVHMGVNVHVSVN
jgi:hypothetical protein